MGYKLICIDMDGTLMNRKKQITEATKESLRKAHDLGVHIVISTGRTYADAEYFSNLIEVKSPVISANGAYIKDKGKNEVIYQSVLGEALALKILDICDQFKVAPSFRTARKEYYGILARIRFAVIYLKRLLQGHKTVITREYIVSHKQWLRMIAAEKGQFVKCVIIHHDQARLSQIRKELESIPELEVVSSERNNIELTCKGVSKGSGAAILARYFNLRPDEIMAIGDNENDISMIEYAGLGVAMGNAIDIVKEKADYVTDTNDNDGVAKVIDKFVLNAARL